MLSTAFAPYQKGMPQRVSILPHLTGDGTPSASEERSNGHGLSGGGARGSSPPASVSPPIGRWRSSA
eukprot:CAMPEP_0115246242 /NCGR_PEP_ID=MMETSP0270-20121206/40923_1 /TAXON_ID=71861 /ORGANISM="Scrippsiella trochoidea, Strain CCMP3099" /LENGTH=66 /DNA_ID=CAMNT_0002661445 /DNA_START=1 /DNA_END=197 /DNA_ORIENTATION=+